MLNYVKIPPLCYDFDVSVKGDDVRVTSPQLDLKICIKGEVPDNIMEMTVRSAHLFCVENQIPLDGDMFLVTSAGQNLEKGGRFQGMFVPEPRLRH